MPALIGRKRASAQRVSIFSFLIPSRIESIVSLIFLAYLIAVHAAGIKALENDPNYSLKLFSLLKSVGDRICIICTVLIPVLLFSGGRNNFMMWFTRWKYSTFFRDTIEGSADELL